MRKQNDAIPIFAGLYRMRGNRYIFQVVLGRGERPTVYLFTRGYCSCSEEVDLRELLGERFYLEGDSMTAIGQFDKSYPEHHQAQYAERLENILVPLLAGELHAVGERGVEGIAALNDRQILRYQEKHPGEGHYYCDYMNACAQLGEYLYGITPNIPIREAHDRMVERIRNKHDQVMRKTFEQVVSSANYLSMTTCWTEKDMKIFDKDPFIVIALEKSDDLFQESKNMHNCVRIYVPSVSNGHSRIYFLHRKKEPENCLDTLEVSGDGRRLIQAKAPCNKRLENKEQTSLIKWCKVKGIKIQTLNLLERLRVTQEAAVNAAIDAALRGCNCSLPQITPYPEGRELR